MGQQNKQRNRNQIYVSLSHMKLEIDTGLHNLWSHILTLLSDRPNQLFKTSIGDHGHIQKPINSSPPGDVQPQTTTTIYQLLTSMISCRTFWYQVTCYMTLISSLIQVACSITPVKQSRYRDRQLGVPAYKPQFEADYRDVKLKGPQVSYISSWDFDILRITVIKVFCTSSEQDQILYYSS